jgi:heat shock protein HslJ
MLSKMLCITGLLSLLCTACVPAVRSVAPGVEPVAAAETSLPAAPMLIGPVWQWVETRYSNDSIVVPPQPEAYTVNFVDGGRVSARADCNQKGGSYFLNGSTLTMKLLQSTMAMCPEGSLENQFVRDLSASAVWFEKDGDLYLDLKYDTGTMHLTPQK